MTIMLGLLALFFLVTVGILQITFKRDGNFTEYAVGGRSFGAVYQSMSFLNTWYPGTVFVAFAGLTAASGVIGFYLLSYSLLTIVLMYLIARRVWLWGKIYDLRTQPDLLALRYDSRHVRALAGLIGIVASFPWLVLGLQGLGLLFQYLTLHKLSFTQSVFTGVAVMVIRQFWTVRMGMRGVVISDLVQGIVAYIGGTLLIVALIAWLVIERGAALSKIDAAMFQIPGAGSSAGPLYLFSLIFTGAVGGWCWPAIFVRLFTADSVKSIKKAAAVAVPISFVFCVCLLLFCLLASAQPEVVGAPEDVWFAMSYAAGGPVILGLAGVVVFAATIGNVDGAIQANGAQIGNDLIGNYVELSHGQLVLAAKGGMLLLTVLAAWISCWDLPALFTLAVVAYQGIVQLAVPQFIGMIWARGTRAGAIAGVVVGFALAVILEVHWPMGIRPLGGLTSGVVALAVNLLVYVGFAWFAPSSPAERDRVQRLIDQTKIRSGAIGER